MDINYNLNGLVYSVHSNSFYCLFEKDEIILFHSQSYGEIPFGISMNSVNDFINNFHIVEGMNILLNPKYLFFEDINLQLELNYISGFNKINNNNDLVPLNVLIDNIGFAIRLIKKKGSLDGLGGLVYVIDELFNEEKEDIDKISLNYFCRSCFYNLKELLKGIRLLDENLMSCSLDLLIGLGIGLTPSMDDILVGLIYTMNSIQDKTGFKVQSLSILKELFVEKYAKKTSLISGTYLKAAVYYDYFSILSEVIEKIMYKNIKEDTSTSFENLLRVGSNSGTEMLLGIVLAFRLVYHSEKINQW